MMICTTCGRACTGEPYAKWTKLGWCACQSDMTPRDVPLSDIEFDGGGNAHWAYWRPEIAITDTCDT
jgi:hypothetical protein